MNKGFLLSLLTLITFSISAQDLYWPLNVNEINTGSNSSYFIPSVTLDGETASSSYTLGAFYLNDAQEFVCGGFSNYSGNALQIAVMGDDTTTDEKDGFYEGEEIAWFALSTSDSIVYNASISAEAVANTYSTNGVNFITAFNISSVIPGCMDASACNFNVNANESDESCTYAETNFDCEGNCIDTDNDSICDTDEISGCQDEAACNFNINATDSDDSCEFALGNCDSCSGETNGTGSVIDNDADDNGICNADEEGVCSEPNACNFNANPINEIDNSLCIYTTGTCDTCTGDEDGTGTIVDNDEDNDGVCNDDEIFGCTNMEACNYNELATENDDNCLLAIGCETCDGNGGVLTNDADDDGVCDEDELVLLGCMDALAFNYSMEANTDDQTCLYDVVVDFTTSSTNTTTNYSVTVDSINLTLGSAAIALGDVVGGFYIVNGEIYCAGTNTWTGNDFSLNLWADDPSTEAIDGVTENTTIYWIVQQEATLFNYLIDFTIVNAPGATFVTQMTLNDNIVIGCEDEAAYNYNSATTVGDGACVDVLYGCLEMDACNYSMEANTADDSCYYIDASIAEFIVNVPLTVTSNASNPSYAWFLNDVLQSDTSNTYTPYVNGVYMVTITDEFGCEVSTSYTLDNIGIEESLASQVNLYPNPASTYLEISSNSQIIENIEIISITGKLMQAHQVNTNKFKIQRTELANGLYFVKVLTNTQEFTKQVVFR